MNPNPVPTARVAAADGLTHPYQAVTAFDRVVRTVCSPNCMGTCGVNAYVKDDRIVRLEPATFPDPGYERICLKGIAMATQRIHHQDRLTHPMIRSGPRGSGQWRRVSWDEAFDYITDKLKHVQQQWGPKANAWISASGNYGFKAYTAAQRIANTLEGTHFTSLALSGDFAGPIGFLSTLGIPGCANDISEIGGARYLLNIGRNAADTAHSEMHFIFDAMERGMKFVMVDPRFTRTAAKADEWLSPLPGTDTALALGMIHVVVRDGLMDDAYVRRYTNAPFLVRRDTSMLLRERDLVTGGSDAFMVWDGATGSPQIAASAAEPVLRGAWQLSAADGARLDCQTGFDANWAVWQHFTPEHASTICDVPAEQIERIAREYATTSPAWIWLGAGPQRYHHGHITWRAYLTLAALCGNIGKPYAGVSLLDGPLVSMVMMPPDTWVAPGGRRGQSLPGTRLLDIIDRADPYPIKSLWASSIGLASQTPFFKRFVKETLPKLDLFAVTEQVMTEAAQYADIVLPCVSYYEDDWDLIGGAENWFVQLRRRAVPPLGESRNDMDIFRGVAERMGQGEHWQLDPEQSCRDYLAQHPDPRIQAVDWEVLRRDGVARVSVPRPYTPFQDLRFPTPSGRIELYQEMFVDVGEAVLGYKGPLEDAADAASPYRLRFITFKHVHSTHSQHTILPAIQEVVGEPRLEIAPADAAVRGIEDNDWVVVFNDRGRFVVRAVCTPAVRPGTVALPQGFWKRHFKSGHPSDLGHIPDNAVQSRLMETNYPIWDVLCDVSKEVSTTQEHTT